MKAVILGAGPAGLAAAYELTRGLSDCQVVEKSATAGGLCRTLSFDQFLFDIGGHRFLSRSAEVNALWQEILGDELLVKTRKSRIYFRGRFFDYPLRPLDALKKLGFWEAARCIGSYARAQTLPAQEGDSFESWMVRRFGRRLYENFFKTYTEKVWGIPCSELSSDWAEQRIQQLTLRQAIGRALFPAQKKAIKTLTDTFYYPRRGPGQFFDRLREKSESAGADFFFGRDVREIHTQGSEVVRVETVTQDGEPETWKGDAFLASLPLSLLVFKMRPLPPEDILKAAASLRFRSFIAVNLVFEGTQLFDDQWIYLHSPAVKAGRLQNYKNWSEGMVPDSSKTSLGMEYFVSEGDELWRYDEQDMVELALRELEILGLASRKQFVKGFTVRVPNAYPVYGPGYETSVLKIRRYVERFKNLQVMGRAGLFRYNNSDHAILTGLFAARNMRGAGHDLWSVDPDASYSGSFKG